MLAFVAFIISSAILIYIVRGITIYVIKKFLKISIGRGFESLSLVISVVLCTSLYYLSENKFVWNYCMGGVMVYAIGVVQDIRGNKISAN